MPAARIALWVASIGALALLFRTLWLNPYPMSVSVVFLVAYLALAGAGIAWPQLEMYGDAVIRGAPGNQRVALTFDDGPNPATTRAVLSILAARGLHATFFVVGRKAALHPEVLREIHEAGHLVGIHGYSHEWFYAFKRPKLVVDDIRRAQEAVERAIGLRPRLFRPPIGRVSPRTAEGARKAGVEVVLWSLRGRDGVSITTPEYTLARIRRGLRDGAIILLHDAAEMGTFTPAGVAALPKILDELERRGLLAVRLDELTGITPYVADTGSSIRNRAPAV